MKKVLLGSCISAAVTEITGVLCNTFSYITSGKLLWAHTEITGVESCKMTGFGMCLNEVWSSDYLDRVTDINTRLSFNLPSLILALAVGFAIGFVICFSVYLGVRLWKVVMHDLPLSQSR